MPPALSFYIYVIPLLRIDFVQFCGSLAWDMKFGCSVSKCDEKLNEGDSRKTLRENHSREKEAKTLGKRKPKPSFPSTVCPPFSPCRPRPSKRGFSPPHTTSRLRVTGTQRERKRE